MAKVRRKWERCPNCDTFLENQQNYCPNCGQENHQKVASIGTLFSDFLQDYWTFDSKFFRSLFPLLFKPGFLTIEYLKGKRQQYIPPIRLYLFITFLFFLFFSLFSGGEDKPSTNNVSHNSEAIQPDTLSVKNKRIVFGTLEYSLEDIDTLDYHNVDGFFNKMGYRVIIALRNLDKDKESGEKLERLLMQNFSIFLFLILPLLSLLFYLFFYRRERYFVNAFVFVLHIQSFLFLLMLLGSIITLFLPVEKILLWVYSIGYIVYVFQATRKVYLNKKRYTLLKLIFLGLIFIIMSSILFLIYLLTLVTFNYA